MARLTIQLLGPPQFTLGGEPIAGFESDKVRALLIYLAVEADRPHRRETLVALLWPESSARAAKDNLRQALSNLRYAVGDRARSSGRALDEDRDVAEPFLLISRQAVQFNPAGDCWVDVHAFDEILREARFQALGPNQDDLLTDLQRAVAFYRGEFLEGFSLGDSVAFEEWALFARERLHRLALDSLYCLAETGVERGDLAQARAHARRQVELEPWREEAHQQLMRALALDGQRSAALAQYETCRRVMAENLVAEPSEETTALYRQILDGSFLRQPAVLIPVPPCPYRGLFAFREQDAAFFFGREDFTRQLVETVRLQPLVTLIGPSGSGKSSVVHAGLLSRLRREEDWAIVDCRPGGQPFRALAAALVPLLKPHLREEGWQAEIDKLSQALDMRTLSLRELAGRILDMQRACGVVTDAGRLLLVIDQFEELYTLCPAEDERRRFLDQLLSAAETDAGRAASESTSSLHVVLTLRADFMGQALAYRPFADALQDAAIILGPMSRRELSEAIENPAKLQGVAFEAGLVARILDDVASEPGNLPLLQFALTSLWEEQVAGQLTHAAYEAAGHVEGALTAHAERVYADLDPAQQEGVRRILEQMVRPGEGTEDTRRVTTRAELGEDGWALAQHLADARLAVTDQDESTGQEMVEVVHEALIRGWDRLRVWMNADRAFRAWQERMRGVLRQWQASGEDAGALLRGLLLVEAENWLAEREGDLSAAGRAFIQASLDAREARRAQEAARLAHEAELERRDRNWLWSLVGVLAVAAIVALGLTLFAFHQRGEAEREAAVSWSLNLSAGAQLALDEGNNDLALALAIQANQIDDPPPQAQLTLSEAAYAPSARRVFVGHDGAVESVAFSPDGLTALSGSVDHSLILWDISTPLNAGLAAGDVIRRFDGHTDVVHSVAFLPDGTRAISASGDGSLIVWDVSSGEIVQRLTGHTDAVWDVAVLPDCGNPAAPGCLALSASADGTLRLWDLETGQTLRQFVGHEGAVYCVDISSDCGNPLAAGYLALSGSADHSLILWDIETGNMIHHFGGQSSTYTHQDLDLYTPQIVGHQGPVWDVAISPAGRIAMSVSEDQYAILWDLETGELVREYQILKSGLFSAGFIPNGRLAVLGTLDGRVALLNPYYGQTEREFLGHQGRVLALDVSADGKSVLSGSDDGSLRLWDLSNGAEVRQLWFPNSGASLDLSPDGKLGLVAHWSGDISLWDYTTGQEIRRLVGHTEMPYAGVKFGPDGRIAISGSGDIFGVAQDKTLRVWDVETGQELHRFEGYADILWDIDLSLEGRWAVSASRDGVVQLWDIPPSLETGTSQGRVLIDLAPQAARSVAISPDGHSVLVGPGKGASAAPDYRLRLLDIETGADLAPPGAFAGHTETVQAVAFSPDCGNPKNTGCMALSSGLDKLVILWDVASGREIQRFVGHTAEVTQVAFSPGCDPAQSETAGRCMVLSAGGDGVIILWDMESGEALRRYEGHQGNILGAVFTPGGRTILSAAVDSTLREWRVDLDYDALSAWIAANRYVPELTCQQRAQYHVEPLCEEGSVP
jgi:WD40 repeat protein/DNA-binding SARP family transcriptional activator